MSGLILPGQDCRPAEGDFIVENHNSVVEFFISSSMPIEGKLLLSYSTLFPLHLYSAAPGEAFLLTGDLIPAVNPICCGLFQREYHLHQQKPPDSNPGPVWQRVCFLLNTSLCYLIFVSSRQCVSTA